MADTKVDQVKADHLRRHGLTGKEPLLYAMLLEGAVLYPRATLKELEVPENAQLTVVLMRATAI